MVRIFLFDVLECNFILTDESNAGFNSRVNICIALAQRTHIDFFDPSAVDENQIEIFLFFQIVFDGKIITLFWLVRKTKHIFSIDFPRISSLIS